MYPEGGIRACTLPVPDPGTHHCDAIPCRICEYNRKTLKACKDSAVRFEDWKTARELLGHGELKPDTFYPLQCEVEIYQSAGHPTGEESQDEMWMSILIKASLLKEKLGVSALIRIFKERYHITRKP